jgi:hypothetical protein
LAEGVAATQPAPLSVAGTSFGSPSQSLCGFMVDVADASFLVTAQRIARIPLGVLEKNTAIHTTISRTMLVRPSRSAINAFARVVRRHPIIRRTGFGRSSVVREAVSSREWSPGAWVSQRLASAQLLIKPYCIKVVTKHRQVLSPAPRHAQSEAVLSCRKKML